MTEPTAGELPGRVLRAWREHAGQSAADLARAMPVRPSAVSMWESGRRARRTGASLDTVRKIGVKLGLDAQRLPALVGMWQAADSVHAVPPRTSWSHNYQPPSAPVWIWLRCGPGQESLVASLEWGPFQGRVETPVSAAGVLVHAPTSVPNPPVQVLFDRPGWADFGQGIIPEGVAGRLGVPLVDGRSILGRQLPLAPPFASGEDDERPLRPWFGRARVLAERLGIRWALVAPQLGIMRPGRSWHALDATAVEATTFPGATLTDDGGLLSQLLLSPDDIQHLRMARGLSREDAARAATGLDEVNPVTAKALEHLETRGRLPAGTFVLARLNLVYQADGRLGIERVFDSRSDRPSGRRRPVVLPRFWTGPVWLQARGPDPASEGTVDLIWGPWRRRQRVRSGTVVTTRKAVADAVPLHVGVPPGWQFTVGVGTVPTALDINKGWFPVNARAATALISDGLAAVARGFRS